jgi:hypothetical protein
MADAKQNSLTQEETLRARERNLLQREKRVRRKEKNLKEHEKWLKREQKALRDRQDVLKRWSEALEDLDGRIEDSESDDAEEREQAAMVGEEARRLFQDLSLRGPAEASDRIEHDDAIGRMS